jgi:hypothetical protein
MRTWRGVTVLPSANVQPQKAIGCSAMLFAGIVQP